MRRAFIEELCAIAELREDIVLLCGDLGFSVLEIFRDRFAGRYFNVGVAEQNMMGMAAGLASAGKIVLTYSIANFAITRCLEQFRNDVCYHGFPVIAVSVGAGVAYGNQGYTHQGIEDIGFTRALPNVAVLSPGDPAETRWALRHLIERRGPASLRLGRGGEPAVHLSALTAGLSEAIVLRAAGRDVTMLVHGSPLPEAQRAAQKLAGEGFEIGLFSMPVVQPLDTNAIELAARTSQLILTVEEHVTEAGFGGAVAEILAGLPQPRARLLRSGIARGGPNLVADQREIRRMNGFDATGLAARVRAALPLQVIP